MLKRASVLLPPVIGVADVADASRHALTTFMALEPIELALSAWFAGPYRRATGFVSLPDQACVWTESSGDAIRDAVRRARLVVRASIEAAMGGADAFVAALPPLVKVIPVHDARGLSGFAPLSEARLRLADRVFALVVADYLTRPADFTLRASRGLMAPSRLPSSAGMGATASGALSAERSFSLSRKAS